ncbi:hypothetical protein [Actinopolymorpha rutila]|uniref:Uncharacterized protein n=1 Tax=Actinopolymorpha rutila TaxID=446787 RepID=A0A852ZIV8_9ACTN|nr:hypothetical protein [Actinopolymorpha rutila]NYH92884.1 hypothetical protein [Actinopolymorpha rutila]
MSPSVCRRPFVLDDGADEVAVIAAHEEGLRVLRGVLRRVWVDVISDLPWPVQVQGAVRALGQLAERRHCGQIDIEVDVDDDEQFELVVAVSPFTIALEGWSEADEEIYSASDTGCGLWLALTPAEEAEFRRRLTECGAEPDAVISQPPRRRR